jgi:hypothetical protein
LSTQVFQAIPDDGCRPNDHATRSPAQPRRTGRWCRRQLDRFYGQRTFTNAPMTSRHVREHCRVDSDAQVLLRQTVGALGFSARACTKILKRALDGWLDWATRLLKIATRAQSVLTYLNTGALLRVPAAIGESRAIVCI